VSSPSERTPFVICLSRAGHDAQRVANESICDVTMIDVSITHAHFFDSGKQHERGDFMSSQNVNQLLRK